MSEREPRSAGKNRFERVWHAWDAAVEEGKNPAELMDTLSSEEILQLLAGAGEERRYELDILATEAANRLARARREVGDAADEVTDIMREVREKGEDVRSDVHATEEVVARLQGSKHLEGNTPQETAAHHASQLTENLMDTLQRAEHALERLEDARRKDLARGSGSDEDSARAD